MSSNYLDSLAANGVIDFDADSYIKGTKPRFVGSPEGGSLPFQQPLSPVGTPHNGKLSGGPQKDAFIKRAGEEEYKPFSWTGLLAGTIAASLAVFTGFKIKSMITPKSKIKEDDVKSPSEVVDRAKETNAKTTLTEKIKSFYNTCKEKVTGFFGKSKKVVEDATKDAAKKAKESADTVAKDKAGFISKLPTWVKRTGVGVIGILGLYGIYNVLSGNKNQSVQAHE